TEDLAALPRLVSPDLAPAPQALAPPPEKIAIVAAPPSPGDSPPKRKRGRPPKAKVAEPPPEPEPPPEARWDPTEEQYRMVKQLAELAWPSPKIAEALKVSPKQFAGALV